MCFYNDRSLFSKYLLTRDTSSSKLVLFSSSQKLVASIFLQLWYSSLSEFTTVASSVWISGRQLYLLRVISSLESISKSSFLWSASFFSIIFSCSLRHYLVRFGLSFTTSFSVFRTGSSNMLCKFSNSSSSLIWLWITLLDTFFEAILLSGSLLFEDW